MRWKNLPILGGLALLLPATALSQQYPPSEILEVTEEGGNYILKVPVSRLVVTFPKGGLVRTPMNIGGGTANPRYFYFKDENQALIVSGWFEPEQRYKGIKQFWAEESENIDRQGLPKLEDVTFESIGKWEVVLYEQRLQKVRMSHLRAEWVQAETWIDFHFSVTGTLNMAEQRAKLREVLNSIQITEKSFGISVAGQSGTPKPTRARAGEGARSINLGGGGEGAGAGGAGSNPRGTYFVPGHGKLTMVVPDEWREFSQPQQSPPALHLRFRPPQGDTFYVQVTAIWLDAEKLANLTPEKLRAHVQQSSASNLSSAVEKVARIQELRGEQTIGYYYSLTDRNPPPEEYKYMTQGNSVTGEFMIVFTILQRVDSAFDRNGALQMLANAIYAK